MSSKKRLATIWLDGCSGCHMSFLDIDERILQLAELADIVYSPLVDTKHMPDAIDIAMVEGSVSTNEDMEKIQKIRARTKILVAFGDCAVTGNVPAMRNLHGTEATYNRSYIDNVGLKPQIPTERLPILLERVVCVHDVVKVDYHLPGCPPPADAIFYVLTELIADREPEMQALSRFGK
ncbi:MAG: NADP oxidoreductase [bacterium]|nr:NADP oxidoreductase [bacterium]